LNMNIEFEEDNKSEIRFSKQKLYRLNSNSILGILNLIKNLLYFLLKRNNTNELPEVIISFRWKSNDKYFKSLINSQKERDQRLKNFFEERFKVEDSEEKIVVKEIEKEKKKRRKVRDVENKTTYPNRNKESPNEELKTIVTVNKIISEDCLETVTKETEIELKTDPDSIITQSNDFSFNNGLVCPYCIENITDAKTNREVLREYELSLDHKDRNSFKEKYKILHHKTMIEHYNKSTDQINLELKEKREEFKSDLLIKTNNFMKFTNQHQMTKDDELVGKEKEYINHIPEDSDLEADDTNDVGQREGSDIDYDIF
jgi:hypothetical protein